MPLVIEPDPAVVVYSTSLRAPVSISQERSESVARNLRAVRNRLAIIMFKETE